MVRIPASVTPLAISQVRAEGLKNYFSQFGPVVHCTIMRDGESGRSRGFAFLTFADPTTVNSVMVREHWLDGKSVSVPYSKFSARS